MSARTRRLTYGRCLGITQRELAAAEGVTQPAVSQALASETRQFLVQWSRIVAPPVAESQFTTTERTADRTASR